MDFKHSPADEAFRLEVRQWFTDNLPRSMQHNPACADRHAALFAGRQNESDSRIRVMPWSRRYRDLTGNVQCPCKVAKSRSP